VRLPLAQYVAPLLAVLTAFAGGTPLTAQRPALDAKLTEVGRATETRTLRITLRMPPGWHIAGPQPTAIGLPTRLGWHLPRGWRVRDERWPTAVREVVGRDTTYTYDRPVQVDVVLARDRDAARGPMEVVISYGLCREVCVPGQLALSYAPK